MGDLIDLTRTLTNGVSLDRRFTLDLTSDSTLFQPQPAQHNFDINTHRFSDPHHRLHPLRCNVIVSFVAKTQISLAIGPMIGSHSTAESIFRLARGFHPSGLPWHHGQSFAPIISGSESSLVSFYSRETATDMNHRWLKTTLNK